MPELGRINIFHSYAHKDELYRERLVAWLDALREEGIVSDWHDRKIVPGADWNREIARNLERSHIVLFLISPAFLASDYSIGIEVKRAIELHWHRRCRIVPVILQPTAGWTETEFGTFQALPRDAKPVSQWPNPEAAYADIVEGIRRVCKEIVDWENPYRRGVVGDWIEGETVYRFPGQRIVSQVRVDLVAMSQGVATAHLVGSGAGQQFDQDVRIPLNEPLADNIQSLLGQFRERIPQNASFSCEEMGRGEEKLFVGGTPYHCSWQGTRLLIDTGEERATFEAKTWRCIDVPLDGIVKTEGTMRDEAGQIVYQTTQTLLGHGRGEAFRRTGTPPRVGKERPEPRRTPVAEELREPDLPEGLYLDRETGLMWTVEDNGKSLHWGEGSTYARKLRLGGYSDWRLPTLEELEDLYDPRGGNQHNIRRPFSLTSTRIWSSTTKGSERLYFNFIDGTRACPDYLMGASGQYPHVLCVRPTG